MDATEGALPDWVRLGLAVQRARFQQGLSQSELAQAAGLTRKTIGNYERGRPPATSPRVPAGYYRVARVLGWRADVIEQVLEGGSRPEPEAARASAAPVPVQSAQAGRAAPQMVEEAPGEGGLRAGGGRPADRAAAPPESAAVPERGGQEDQSPQRELMGLIPKVYRFGSLCQSLGASAALRDELESVVAALIAAVTRPVSAVRDNVGLAAYRPHGWGEGDPTVPLDDAERIRKVLEGRDTDR